MKENEFTADPVAAANRRLRSVLGCRFSDSRPSNVGMISEEIEELRTAGKTAEAIAGLLRDTVGVDVDADALKRYYAPPRARGFGDR